MRVWHAPELSATEREALRQVLAGGVPVEADMLKRVRVDAVRYAGSEARIWADGRELALSDLRGVVEAGN